MTARWLLGFLLCSVALPAEAQRQFRDCQDCPLMVSTPPGQFNMGFAPGEDRRSALETWGEEPAQTQTFIRIERGFGLSREVITRAQFEAFANATHRPLGEHCETLERQTEDSIWYFQIREG